MLFAILTFTRASICATITAVVPEPGGVTVIVGDSAAETGSTAHGGGGGWEWLESTRTFGDDITRAYFGIRNTSTANTTFYMSQPIAVFGNSIGEGNYTKPKNEIIYFDKGALQSNAFAGGSFSDTGTTELELEGEESGWLLPSGVKSVFAQVGIRDSASASTSGGCYIFFEDSDGGSNTVLCSTGGVTNDYYTYHNSVKIKCGEDGNFEYGIEASGSSTTDIDIYYHAIELH